MKCDVLIFSQEKSRACLQLSGPASDSAAKIDECFLCPPLLPVIPLKFDVCVRTRIFPPINYAHLPHGYKKTTLSFHKLFFLPSPCCFFFFFLKANTAASVERRTNPIPRSRPGFSPVFARQKTQLSLHMNLRRSAAAIAKERSVTIYSETEI